MFANTLTCAFIQNSFLIISGRIYPKHNEASELQVWGVGKNLNRPEADSLKLAGEWSSPSQVVLTKMRV